MLVILSSLLKFHIMFTGKKDKNKPKRIEEEDIISSASNFKPMKSGEDKKPEVKPIRMSYADVVKLNLDEAGNVSRESCVTSQKDVVTSHMEEVTSHRSSIVSSTPRSEYQSDNEGRWLNV